MTRNRKKKNIDACIYCGSTNHITKDHIPPRLLFPDPKPSNLITVPCCKTCNQGFQKDDEYFRNNITSDLNTYENPAARQVLRNVFNSLRRSKARGLRISTLNSLGEAELVTPSGLFIQKVGTIKIDPNRIERVVARIVKGLFYHEREHRLPDDYMCGVFWERGMRGLPEEMNEIISIVLQQKASIIVKEVFQYQVAFVGKNLNYSAWILTFYGAVRFLCMTLTSRNK